APAGEDLPGMAGRGSEGGTRPTEADAPCTIEHAPECATGDGGQCWTFDGGSRRKGGAALPVQGRVGPLGSAPRRTVDSPSRQTGVHSQTGDYEEARTRDSRDC